MGKKIIESMECFVVFLKYHNPMIFGAGVLVKSSHQLSPSGLVCWWDTQWALVVYITCSGG